MYFLVCSTTSIESLSGFRVFCDLVGARGVFSSINETFSQILRNCVFLGRMRQMSKCLFARRSMPSKGSPDFRPTSAYCICTPRFSTLDGPRIR